MIFLFKHREDRDTEPCLTLIVLKILHNFYFIVKVSDLIRIFYFQSYLFVVFYNKLYFTFFVKKSSFCRH
jgi:hypothetical protein